MNEKYDTPLTKQWFEIKKTLPPNTLLAIRLGDFWEFFEEDAERVGEELQVTVTKRRHIKMAGLFVHRQETDQQFNNLNKKYNIAFLETLENGKREITKFREKSS